MKETFIAMLFLAMAIAKAEYSGNPILLISIERPILVSSDDPAKPATTRINVAPLNFPAGARFSYSWQQVQDVMSPFAAKMEDHNLVHFKPSDAATTLATFTGSGVFEIRLTVTDSIHNITLGKNTWVNVWDSHSHIMVDGKADPLGVAPGILPPTSVRRLSPDPGPFCHPRLLCTNRDWLEISQRCREGKLASMAVKKMRKDLESNFDDPKQPFGILTASLESYADSNFRGTVPDLTMGIQPEKGDKGLNWDHAKNKLREYSERLRDACFLAWINQNPFIPPTKTPEPQSVRTRKLAKVTAALSYTLLSACWDRKTGAFHKDYPLYIKDLEKPGEETDDMSCVGLAYDFICAWMAKPEQLVTRDFLFAQSVGRTTGERVVNFASGVHGRLLRGGEQNGDFRNIAETRVLNALAVEGEEKAISPQVLKTFTNPQKPADFDKSPDFVAYDWMKFANEDGGGAGAGSKPYPDACSWPNARKASIDNLQREIWWNDDWYVSPWGFTLNREAYYGFSAWGLWPAALAFAIHGGENQYVTGLYYTTILHLLYSCYPGEGDTKSDDYRSNIYLYDHHDGGGDYRQTHITLMKYMYPDDPAVDYYYASNAPGLGFNPFILALFGLDPGINGHPTALPQLAAQKALPLTKLDPQQGVVVARSGWRENDMALYFDAGWAHTGHMHAEKNSFSFYALGRAWCIPPGYHVVPSNYQSAILIQDPAYKNDPDTEGYIGESPAVAPKNSTYPQCFPSPPGKLLEVTEGPAKDYTLIAGDASAAYNYCYGPGESRVDTKIPRSDFMYPGLLADLTARCPLNKELMAAPLVVNKDYNPVCYAFRTVLFVRGARPYTLIVDDIKKEDKPRDYRWTMNCAQAFGGPDCRFVDAKGNGNRSSLTVAPGATATDAVLYHTPIDDENQPVQPGLPRLLFRDLSETDNTSQPAIRIERKLGADPPSCRVLVDRKDVIEPKYKILFFPYKTGEPLPDTRWNKDHTSLEIALKNGTVDTIRFDNKQEDHRTRLQFSRSNK